MGSMEKEPLTVVAALMLNLDSQWGPVERDLKALEPKKIYEFKGTRLFRDLRNGRLKEEANRLLCGVLSLPVKHKLPIFYAAIDRLGFQRFAEHKGLKRAKPYEMAFMCCLHAVDMLVHTFFS